MINIDTTNEVKHNGLYEVKYTTPPVDYDPMSIEDYDPLNIASNEDDIANAVYWLEWLVLGGIAVATLLGAYGVGFLFWLIFTRAF